MKASEAAPEAKEFAEYLSENSEFYRAREAEFVDGYFAKRKHAPKMYKKLRVVLPIVFVASVAAAVLSVVLKEASLYEGLLNGYLTFMMGAPVAVFFANELPMYFSEDVIMRNPSPNIMNKMAQSVLTLYSYDSSPEDKSIESEMLKAISVISRLPAIMVTSYQTMRRFYHNDSMVMHQINKDESLAESILSTLRDDRSYTPEEAKLLDLCLMLHAEHGGGNNSTFTCRTVSSSGTDAYSAYAAAIGSLKGHRHGGANIKVMEMQDYVKTGVHNWEDDHEVKEFLRRILRKQEGDRSGLIYGMGHAVYTLSDPRAVILKENAMKLAKGTEFEREFMLLDAIERLTPEVFAEERGAIKDICANVDMYSGLVYRMLRIPTEMYTGLFACARMAGWCAHRMEEMINGKRIIRPAYKAINLNKKYVPLDQRK